MSGTTRSARFSRRTGRVDRVERMRPNKPQKGKTKAKRKTTRATRKSPKTVDRHHELEQRLAEAEAQQAATSEVLRVIRRSPTDVRPVFETIVQSAVRLCD